MALSAVAVLACDGGFEPTGAVPSDASPQMSVVTVSANQVEVGSSVNVTLVARDSAGNDLTEGGLVVAFTASGGTSQGSFGSTTDQGNGRYQATYTGTAAGTPATIGATIDGVPVTSSLPTLEVIAQPPDVPPGVSPGNSVLTVSADEVQVGQAATVVLQVRDENGNDVSVSGLTVSFNASGGTSQGSFGTTTYQGNGQYSTTYTGTAAGSATTIGASINGEAVTNNLPTVQVLSSPTPPGEPVCEATDGARCWYVAANAPQGGTGTFASPLRRPQDAATQAGPGDFIYLRGGAEFTHEHAYQSEVHGSFIVFLMFSIGPEGAPGRLITLKSYPGEQAVVRGTLAPGEHIGIKVGKSHWRVEGIRMYHGYLAVGHSGSGLDVEDVWIVGNHFSDVIATPGNFGIINVTGQHTQLGPEPDHSLDPVNVYIHDNVIHTLWGEQPDGSVLPWDQDIYIEHHACFMLQKSGGLVELVGNEFYECANIFYSKWEGPGPFVARDNYFHDAQNIVYRWRSDRPEFENNVFARFERLESGFNISHETVVGGIFRNNTFDLAPWTGNSQGTLGAVTWNGFQHVFRDNVVFARQYHENDPATSSDIDGNCVIWDNSLVAVQGYDWAEYQSAFGHDPNGVRVIETTRTDVFADAANGDYTLIGAAATQCGSAGS